MLSIIKFALKQASFMGNQDCWLQTTKTLRLSKVWKIVDTCQKVVTIRPND